MHTKHIAAGVLLALLALAVGAQAPTTTDLPLRQVVLYTSGLAYFEHGGTVNGDATIRLTFRIDQVNDVIKSLVVRDLGGGAVRTVSYGTQDPIERSLGSFALDLSANPGLADLLGQVRGHRVTVQAPSTLKGRVLGVETRRQVLAGTAGPVESFVTVVNLMTDTGLRSVPLDSLQSFQLDDPRLQQELAGALDVLATSTDTERRTVDIILSGKGTREVRFGYLMEAPVWKTSYRLDLSGKAPFLQAWAMVENASDLDWSSVQLSLSGGQPISFIQDLYSPLYAQRPVVAPFLPPNITPRTYDTGLEGQVTEAYAERETFMDEYAPAMAPPAPAAAKSMAYDEAPAYERVASGPSATSLAGSGQGTASIQSSGEAYYFAIKDPISLGRHQSAMLPLLGSDLAGGKVSIYNSTTHPSRPLLGARISAPAGSRYPAGPLTVFDGGMYAGDALVQGLNDSDRTLVSYGVDTDLVVQPEATQARETMGFSLVKGVLTHRTSTTYTTRYSLKNGATSSRTVLVEHPWVQGRDLKAPAKYDERTTSHYRFHVEVAKGATATLAVEETQPGAETIRVSGLRASAFGAWTSMGGMTAKVKDALMKAAGLKLTVENEQQRLNDLGQQRTGLASDQGRLRDNIQAVGRDSTQGQVYVKKLAEQETALENLDKEMALTRTRIQKAQEAFDTYLNGLDLQ